MKALLLSIILFICLNSDGLCQIATDAAKVKLDYSLRLKLKEIDQYVHRVDSIKLLMVNDMVGEMTNGGTIEEYVFYADSLSKTVIKRISKMINVPHPETSTMYYRNNQVIYLKTIFDQFSAKPKFTESYYDRAKMIYASKRHPI